MIKRLIVISVVIATGFITSYQIKNLINSYSNKNIEVPKLNTQSLKKDESVAINFTDYRAYYFKVNEIEKLNLYPNYSQKLSSVQILDDKKCTFLVNAGFYDTNSKPIGLFSANGVNLSSFQKNELLNGVFYVDYKNTPLITRSEPTGSKYAFQSGPIFIYNSQYMGQLNSDKNSRRIVLIITDKNELIFAVFYKKDYYYQGPALGEMYEVLNRFSNEIGIKIKSALNLDGGSASFFIKENVTLKEVSPVGSYFCYIN